jgi:Icc-related predicted phosphoesterase
MRVNVISDLHLEFGDLVLPGGDVLILSGDVVEAKHLKQADYTPEIIALSERTGMKHHRYMRFFNEECAKYREVIYVMGNHEHYGFKFDDTYDHLVSNLPSNVHLLEKQTYEIDGVVFIGGTMWTDLNKGDPITSYTLSSGMNDYRVITKHYKDRNVYYKLTPDVTRTEHMRTKQFISDAVTAAGDKKVVVVTHHSPSRQSTTERYKDEYHMNGGYSSDMDGFILDHPQVRVWTHGHTHDTFDYMIGQTRIMCNPRGYAGYEQRARDFDPTIGFDI